MHSYLRCAPSILCLLLFALVLGCGGDSEPPPESPEANSGQPPQVPTEGAAQSPPKEPDPETPPPPPRVKIKTSKGEIYVVLHPERVPQTVSNFLGYVDRDFYANTVFHEVIADYAIVGGGYLEDLSQKPPTELAIPNEAKNAASNTRGTIAMARKIDQPDSAKCQFFFNLRDNSSNDYVGPAPNSTLPQNPGYCVFGHVDDEQSLLILERIGAVAVESRGGMFDVPTIPIVIEGITRL